MVIFDEPTVGVDVAAKADIYREIGALADSEVGVLIVTSDLAELVGLADRALSFSAARSLPTSPRARSIRTGCLPSCPPAATRRARRQGGAPCLRCERLTPDALLRAGAYGALTVVFVVFAVAAPGFLSFANLANVVHSRRSSACWRSA